jgi:hypothetical protein
LGFLKFFFFSGISSARARLDVGLDVDGFRDSLAVFGLWDGVIFGAVED